MYYICRERERASTFIPRDYLLPYFFYWKSEHIICHYNRQVPWQDLAHHYPFIKREHFISLELIKKTSLRSYRVVQRFPSFNRENKQLYKVPSLHFTWDYTIIIVCGFVSLKTGGFSCQHYMNLLTKCICQWSVQPLALSFLRHNHNIYNIVVIAHAYTSIRTSMQIFKFQICRK